VNRFLATVAVFGAVITVAAQHAGWQANPELVQQLSAKQPQVNYDEQRVGKVD